MIRGTARWTLWRPKTLNPGHPINSPRPPTRYHAGLNTSSQQKLKLSLLKPSTPSGGDPGNPKNPRAPSPAAVHRRENGKVTEVGSDVQYECTAAVGTHTAVLQHLVEDLGGGGGRAGGADPRYGGRGGGGRGADLQVVQGESMRE